jgi:uncharacterized cupin superfamily protein
MIFNLREVEPNDAEDHEGFRFGHRWIRDELETELLGCSLYELPPGQQLWPYHYHLGNEEWAVVVAGAPTVRTPAGERELAVGDLVAFPEGDAGAHTFLNHGQEPARVALFSTRNPPTLPVYPDSGKIGANRRYYRVEDAVDYWHGE